MQNEIIKKALSESATGYARFKTVLNDNGKPCDFIFLDMNETFSDIIGEGPELLIDKHLDEVYSMIDSAVAERIGEYGQAVFGSGGKHTFEQYAESNGRWYRVQVMSFEKNHFTAIYTDITANKSIVEASREFLEATVDKTDYKKIAEKMRMITGARYVALNVFLENGVNFKTTALAGLSDVVTKATKILGFDLFSKTWGPDEHRMEMIEGETVTVFEYLHDLTGNALSSGVVNLVERTFSLGRVYIIKVTKDDRMLGDFTLMFNRGKVLENRDQAVLYAELAALFLEKQKTGMRYNLSFEKANDALFLLDKTGRIDRVNRKAETLLGYRKDELEGRSVVDFLAESEQVRADKTYKAVFRKGKARLETIIVTKKGKEKIVEASASLIDEENGIVINALRDITVQSEMETRLRESKDNFRSFFHTIADLVFVASLEGRILFANKAVTEKLGYRISELKRMNIPDIHGLQDRKEAEEIYQDVLRGHKLSCPLPLQTKDSIYLPAETKAWFGRWNGERVIFAIAEDLSAEQAALAKFEKLFQANPALMSIISVNNRKILDVNRAFLETMEYRKDEVIDHTLAELDVFLTKAEHELISNEFLKNGRIVKKEIKVKTKSGRILTGLLSGEIIENPVERVFLSVMTDITKQKQAEEKEREASRAKSEFLANMSHEIRTPLNGIIGFTQLLNRSKLNQKQTRYIHSVLNSANALMEIINDILDFSKIEAGKLELNPEKTDLRSLCSNIMKIFKYRTGEKDLTLKLDIPEEIPAYVRVDSVRLKQVILNLLGNAVKFTDEGEVQLRLRMKAYDEKFQKSEILFSVEDTGIGITEKNQEKIFEAFSQEDLTTTKHFGGTGLGLTISNQILKMMNSKLSLKSEIGKGSSFFFTVELPFEVAESTSADEFTAVKKSIDCNRNARLKKILESGKILITEDNETNMRYARAAISSFMPNATILEARNGEQAVEMTKKASPDLIFMDIRMPGMDGYEASRQIRRFNTSIPIIALTAGVIKGEKERCRAAGMNDYLPKPVSVDSIEKRLKELMTGEKETVADSDVEKKHHGEDAFHNVEALEEQLDGEEQIIREILGLFRDDIAEKMKELQHTDVTEESLNALRLIIHTIKGEAANLCFEQLHTVSQELIGYIDKADVKELEKALPGYQAMLKKTMEQIDVELTENWWN